MKNKARSRSPLVERRSLKTKRLFRPCLIRLFLVTSPARYALALIIFSRHYPTGETLAPSLFFFFFLSHDDIAPGGLIYMIDSACVQTFCLKKQNHSLVFRNRLVDLSHSSLEKTKQLRSDEGLVLPTDYP